MTIRFSKPAVNYDGEDVEVAVHFYIDHFGFIETLRTPQEGTPIYMDFEWLAILHSTTYNRGGPPLLS